MSNKGNNSPVAPHEDSPVSSLDREDDARRGSLTDWVKKHKKTTAGIATALVVLIGGGTAYGVMNQEETQKDVVSQRHFNHEVGQQNLPSAKVIKGVGKGMFTAKDNLSGKTVNAEVVGIDATGDANNAVLAPPEDISQIGWYIRSAPFGVNEGSTVLTSHIDYNGVVGLGTLFPSMKKGDPITLTDGNGKEHHYTVTMENTPINKSDPDYIKKTQSTINKKTGKNSLVLVSCYGEYVGGSLGYADNSVVVATPINEGKNVQDYSKK